MNKRKGMIVIVYLLVITAGIAYLAFDLSRFKVSLQREYIEVPQNLPLQTVDASNSAVTASVSAATESAQSSSSSAPLPSSDTL